MASLLVLNLDRAVILINVNNLIRRRNRELAFKRDQNFGDWIGDCESKSADYFGSGDTVTKWI